MDKSQNTNISGERALKLLRKMAVAGTLFCLNHINAKQEHTQNAGMGRRALPGETEVLGWLLRFSPGLNFESPPPVWAASAVIGQVVSRPQFNRDKINRSKKETY